MALDAVEDFRQVPDLPGVIQVIVRVATRVNTTNGLQGQAAVAPAYLMKMEPLLLVLP
jgi:hypothetical protein